MEVKVSCNVTGTINWRIQFDNPVPDFQEGLNNGKYVLFNNIVFNNESGKMFGKVVELSNDTECKDYVVS